MGAGGVFSFEGEQLNSIRNKKKSENLVIVALF